MLNEITDILGKIIPSAVISKITLEEGSGNADGQGGRDVQPYKNPHVDAVRTANLTHDPRTGKLIAIAQALPNVENKSNTKSNSSKLLVTLDIVIKESFDDSQLGTWINQEQLKKYIKVKVVQSTNERLTQEMLDSEFIAHIDQRDPILPYTRSPVADKLNIIAQESGTKLGSQAFLKENLTVQTVSVAAVVNDPLLRLNEETDSSGETIISIPVQMKFTLDNSEPKFLSYFVFCYLDLIQLIKDQNLTITPANSLMPLGKMSSEIVFRNGKTVDESFYFIGEDDQIWIGSTTTLIDGSFAGYRPDGSTFPLRKVSTGNGKLQDFRIYSFLERQIFDFSYLENEILRTQLTSLATQRRRGAGTEMIVSAPENSISDLFVSRNQLGQMDFFFSVNVRRLLEKYSIYGKIFESKEFSSKVLQGSAIVGMRLIRRRIQGSPKIGSPPEPGFPFERNQIDSPFISTGEKNYNQFIGFDTDIGSLKEIAITVPVESSKKSLNNIRFFSGTDKEVARFSDGYYIYGLELEILDSGISFLVARIKDLNQARQSLEKYYIDATKQSSHRTIVQNTNPHVRVQGQSKSKDAYEYMPGNFDVRLNRFTENFIQEQMVLYPPSVDGDQSPWGLAISVYLANLNFFSKTLIPYDSFAKYLLFLTSPATGSPSGISKLLDLILMLIKALNNLVGSNDLNMDGPAATASKGTSQKGFALVSSSGQASVKRSLSGIKGKIPYKTVKTAKWFSQVVNAAYNQVIGFDYLDVPKTKGGLVEVSGKSYKDRIKLETDHYFQDAARNTDIDLSLRDKDITSGDSLKTTEFTFLTPAVVKYQGALDIRRLGKEMAPTLQGDHLVNLLTNIKTLQANSQPSLLTSVGQNVEQPHQNEAVTAVTKLLHGKGIFLANNKVAYRQAPLHDNASNIRGDPRLPADPVPLAIDNTTRALESNQTTPSHISAKEKDNASVLFSLLKSLPNLTIKPQPPVASSGLIGKDLNVSLKPKTQAGYLNLPKASYIEPFADVKQRKPTLSPSLATTVLNPTSINKPIAERTLKQKIGAFDITAGFNFLNKIIQDPDSLAGLNLGENIKQLPNQSKALLLGKTRPELVQTDWHSIVDEDNLSLARMNHIFKFDHRFINKVEVFNGYEQSKTIDPNTNTAIIVHSMIQNPVWLPFTEDLFNSAKGKALLCRMKPYENSMFGITRDIEYELPTYNEYFLITLDTAVEPIRSFKDKINESIKKENLNQLAVPLQAISTNHLQQASSNSPAAAALRSLRATRP